MVFDLSITFQMKESLCVCLCVCVVSHSVMSDPLQLYETVVYQDPLCIEFSRSGNPGVGSRSLLQELFLTQGLNPDPLHWRQILYLLSHQEIPEGDTAAAAAKYH